MYIYAGRGEVLTRCGVQASEHSGTHTRPHFMQQQISPEFHPLFNPKHSPPVQLRRLKALLVKSVGADKTPTHVPEFLLKSGQEAEVALQHNYSEFFQDHARDLCANLQMLLFDVTYKRDLLKIKAYNEGDKRQATAKTAVTKAEKKVIPPLANLH